MNIVFFLHRFFKPFVFFLSLLFYLHCLSIEERLVEGYEGYSFPQNDEPGKITIVLSPPKENSIYLGELRMTYNKGYRQAYIMNQLKKRAAELGAHILYIKNKEQIRVEFSVGNVQTGNAYPYETHDKKFKVTAGIYRKIEEGL